MQLACFIYPLTISLVFSLSVSLAGARALSLLSLVSRPVRTFLDDTRTANERKISRSFSPFSRPHIRTQHRHVMTTTTTKRLLRNAIRPYPHIQHRAASSSTTTAMVAEGREEARQMFAKERTRNVNVTAESRDASFLLRSIVDNDVSSRRAR